MKYLKRMIALMRFLPHRLPPIPNWKNACRNRQLLISSFTVTSVAVPSASN